MVNSRVSDGELSQMRRNLRRDPHAYSSATRALFGVEADPLAFLAEEGTRYELHMKFVDVLQQDIFKVTSHDGYLVGTDFLTNQPIFRKY